MSQESAPRPENEDERDKNQFTLKQLLLFVTGASAFAGLVYWLRRIHHVVHNEGPLQDEWADLRKYALDQKPRPQYEDVELRLQSRGQQFLEKLSTIYKQAQRHNDNVSWFGEGIRLNKIIPPAELAESVRSLAQWEFKELQRRLTVGDLYRGRAGMLVSDLIERLTIFEKLAAAGKMSVDELLRDVGGKQALQEAVKKKIRMIWSETRVVSRRRQAQRDKQALADELRNKKAKARLKNERMQDNEIENNIDVDADVGGNDLSTPTPSDDEYDKPTDPPVKTLVSWMNQIAQAAGIKLEDLEEISQQDIRKLLEPEAKEVWKDIENWRSTDRAERDIRYIVELAQLAGTKPEDITSRKDWRRLLGELARAACLECDDFLKNAPAVPNPGWESHEKELWERTLFFLKAGGNLLPSDPEVKIPNEVWLQLEKKFGVPALLPGKNDNTTKEKRAEIKESSTEAIATTQSSWVLRTLSQMRKNALSLDTVVMTTEVAAAVTAAFLSSPAFIAVTSVAVTIKVAQLTGSLLRWALGKTA